MAIAGALTIAFSAILVKQAGVSPSTAAIFRCAYAVPVLGALAWWEDRRLGRAAGATARWRRWRASSSPPTSSAGTTRSRTSARAWPPCWATCRSPSSPLVAWLVLGERPAARLLATLPLVLIGVVLVSGVLEDGAYGADPTQGVLYGAGHRARLHRLHPRPARGQRRAAARRRARCSTRPSSPRSWRWRPGLVIGDADLVPSWPAHAWLCNLALSSQVLGWLLISASLPRLPAALTSLLLTIQPVGSVVLGALLFAEAPSGLQLVGVAAILAGLVMVARVRPPPMEGI